jgi:hypothetical protein
MAKSKPNAPFTGHWRIVSMSAWDKDFIDEEEGFFELEGRIDNPSYVNHLLARVISARLKLTGRGRWWTQVFPAPGTFPLAIRLGPL